MPFKYTGIGPIPQKLSDVIAADLVRSGKFKPVDVAQMPQQPSEDQAIDYASWVNQGVEAVLVGQNTGKTYRVSEGDGLAYGGRLAQITGDTVTLSWPNRTVTLSVFD